MVASLVFSLDSSSLASSLMDSTSLAASSHGLLYCERKFVNALRMALMPKKDLLEAVFSDSGLIFLSYPL